MLWISSSSAANKLILRKQLVMLQNSYLFFEVNRGALQQGAHQLVWVPCDGVGPARKNRKRQLVFRAKIARICFELIVFLAPTHSPFKQSRAWHKHILIVINCIKCTSEGNYAAAQRSRSCDW